MHVALVVYSGITALLVTNYCDFSMSPRYYSHSFTIPTVIFSITVANTIVTVLLLHSPLSCHSLILMSLLFSELW